MPPRYWSNPTMDDWQPYIPRASRLRVRETSCCGEYELAAEGGQYIVLRRTRRRGYEETARGMFAQAAGVYADLASQHVCRSQAS